MNSKYLFAVLLGGKTRKNHLMEDHHLVFVIAENDKDARTLAKKKWDAEEMHVDGTQKIENIDGYKIRLERNIEKEDDFQVNTSYSK